MYTSLSILISLLCFTDPAELMDPGPRPTTGRMDWIVVVDESDGGIVQIGRTDRTDGWDAPDGRRPGSMLGQDN